MIVTFCGHRDCCLEESARKKLKQTIENIVKSESNIEFYLGGYGKFDKICLDLLKNLKEKDKNFEIIFVTPYLDNSYLTRKKEGKNYDKTIYPPIENVPKKFAIEKRNFYMVDNADVLICYINFEFGGAYKMYKRGLRKGIKVLNLAN